MTRSLGQPDRTDLLITELQDRVRSLEEANRENRRIIATLTQRIPALDFLPPETISLYQGGATEESISELPRRSDFYELEGIESQLASRGATVI